MCICTNGRQECRNSSLPFIYYIIILHFIFYYFYLVFYSILLCILLGLILFHSALSHILLFYSVSDSLSCSSASSSGITSRVFISTNFLTLSIFLSSMALTSSRVLSIRRSAPCILM